MRVSKLNQVLKDVPTSDIRRILSYRADFFGQPFSTALQAVLRGPSDWSVGERELFAAFVSRLNQCDY